MYQAPGQTQVSQQSKQRGERSHRSNDGRQRVFDSFVNRNAALIDRIVDDYRRRHVYASCKIVNLIIIIIIITITITITLLNYFIILTK